jgi:hypothetical protein
MMMRAHLAKTVIRTSILIASLHYNLKCSFLLIEYCYFKADSILEFLSVHSFTFENSTMIQLRIHSMFCIFNKNNIFITILFYV